MYLVDYVLRRNDKRYSPSEYQEIHNPELILIVGTKKQAKHVAKTLSSCEAGCDYYYYVLDDEELDALIKKNNPKGKESTT